MESLKKYKAIGLVFGNYYGRKGSYPAEPLMSESKETLIKLINDGIANGSLSGVGHESLIGAIMDIITISTITHDGKDYINEETETELFGNLTEQEQSFLENAYENIGY